MRTHQVIFILAKARPSLKPPFILVLHCTQSFCSFTISPGQDDSPLMSTEVMSHT